MSTGRNGRCRSSVLLLRSITIVMTTNRNRAAGHQAGAAGPSDRPTALFTSQNPVTCGAIKVLHALGLQHEVALVGFDDVQLAEVFDPGITVVTQDVARLGQLATERIFARMDGDDGPARTFTVPTDMIVRGSGEITGTPLRAVR